MTFVFIFISIPLDTQNGFKLAPIISIVLEKQIYYRYKPIARA